MGCLDIYTKITMLLNQLTTTKKMLADECIRPACKEKLIDDMTTVKRELKGLYFDLFKIMSN